MANVQCLVLPIEARECPVIALCALFLYGIGYTLCLNYLGLCKRVTLSRMFRLQVDRKYSVPRHKEYHLSLLLLCENHRQKP